MSLLAPAPAAGAAGWVGVHQQLLGLQEALVGRQQRRHHLWRRPLLPPSAALEVDGVAARQASSGVRHGQAAEQAGPPPHALPAVQPGRVDDAVMVRALPQRAQVPAHQSCLRREVCTQPPLRLGTSRLLPRVCLPGPEGAHLPRSPAAAAAGPWAPAARARPPRSAPAAGRPPRPPGSCAGSPAWVRSTARLQAGEVHRSCLLPAAACTGGAQHAALARLVPQDLAQLAAAALDEHGDQRLASLLLLLCRQLCVSLGCLGSASWPLAQAQAWRLASTAAPHLEQLWQQLAAHRPASASWHCSPGRACMWSRVRTRARPAGCRQHAQACRACACAWQPSWPSSQACPAHKNGPPCLTTSGVQAAVAQPLRAAGLRCGQPGCCVGSCTVPAQASRSLQAAHLLGRGRCDAGCLRLAQQGGHSVCGGRHLLRGGCTSLLLRKRALQGLRHGVWRILWGRPRRLHTRSRLSLLVQQKRGACHRPHLIHLTSWPASSATTTTTEPGQQRAVPACHLPVYRLQQLCCVVVPAARRRRWQPALRPPCCGGACPPGRPSPRPGRRCCGAAWRSPLRRRRPRHPRQTPQMPLWGWPGRLLPWCCQRRCWAARAARGQLRHLLQQQHLRSHSPVTCSSRRLCPAQSRGGQQYAQPGLVRMS